MPENCSKCGTKSNLPGDLHCRKLFVDHLEELLSKHKLDEAQQFINSVMGDSEWNKWWIEVSRTKFARLETEIFERQRAMIETKECEKFHEYMLPLKKMLDAREYRSVETNALLSQWEYGDIPIWQHYNDNLRTQIPLEEQVPIKYTHRENWQSFKNVITRYNIKYIVHCTKRENLPNIINRKGLFSLNALQSDGSNPDFISSNSSREIDEYKNIKDYIHTSFKKSPMMYAHNDLVELHIDPRFIYAKETMFSQINSADNSAIIGSTLEHFNAINFDIATGVWSGDNEKKMFQAEILIRHHVPKEFILNL